MSLPSSLLAVLAIVLSLATSACAQAPAQGGPRAAPLPQKALPAKRAPSAPQDLTELTLYELLLAEIALQRGETGLAAHTYLQLAKRTLDARVARRAVEVANGAKMTDAAIEAAKIWQQLEPSSRQALQVAAALLVSAKRVEEAQPYLEKLLAGDGANVENGFLQLGRLLAGNPDKAANLRLVRNLAAAHPKLPAAHFAISQAAAAAEQEPLALVAIREALALRPDWEQGALWEAHLLQKRSPAEAAKALGDFVERHPAARDARLGYARMLVLDKRYADARKQFETLLSMNPGNTEVIYAVGVLAYQLKDFQVAEENMKRLLGMPYRDHDAVRYLLGQIAEEQKQWSRAIDWYKQIQDGDHALPARMRTAGAIAKQGRLDEARDYLKRIEPAGPTEEVQLVVAEAQILRDANRPGDAYETLAQALKRTPEQPELLYDYALTAEKLERYEVAEENLRKLIQVKPDHAHAYNALGYSLAERNTRLPEARKLIEKALELAPEDAFIIDSFGWVLYRQGDLAGAARELRRAYSGRPDAEIAAHLGEVLWMMGEHGEAERVWKQGLESSPENETLQKTIKRLRR